MLKVTITGLSAKLKQRVEDATVKKHSYKDTIFDPTTPEFIPDPNDPEAELMVPMQDRMKPNPMSKEKFVEFILERFLSETLEGYEEELALGTLGKDARKKAKTDLLV